MVAVAFEAEQVLKSIEKQAGKQFLPIIGPAKGRYLAETVIKYKVKDVLEVGTLVGYSTILIAKNLPPDGKVITLERNPRSAKVAGENISKSGLAEKIEVIVGDALDVIPGLKGVFDMVFLDATKEEYLAYLKLCEGKVKKGGVVFADNVKIFAEAMADFLEYVRGSGKYRSQYIDVGSDGVEVSIKLF